MAKMSVIAVKLTEDAPSTKIIYSKNGKFFMRTGEDNFTTGKPVGNINALYKYGFRKVENPPEFRDAEDIQHNIDRFEIKPQGSVVYSG